MLAWGPKLAMTIEQQPGCRTQLEKLTTDEEAAWCTQCRSEAGKPVQAYLEGAQMAADGHVRGDKLPQQDTI